MAGLESLVKGILAGEARALGRAITHVENGTVEGKSLLQTAALRPGEALRIGVTGPPGVGKSTMVQALAAIISGRGQSVGVVAVDPTSPFTGGALLGDRVRMGALGEEEKVFIRSMATRGAEGGLAPAAQDVADLLDAAGKKVVFLETVGTGQSEIAVSAAADCVLLLVSPESGDAIQAMKAGILEIADIVVVNKADREGAERLAQEIRSAFESGLSSRKDVPVLRTEAVNGGGVEALVSAMNELVEGRKASGAFGERRRSHAEARIRLLVEERMRRRLWEGAAGDGLECSAGAVHRGELSIHEAAEKLMAEMER